MFFKRYRKKSKLRKFLVDLNRLLRKRYGKSRYYTEGQVKKTIDQERLDRRFLWHGYVCFVDPAIGNQVIGGDQPVDADEVLSDIGEAFSLDAAHLSIDKVYALVDNQKPTGRKNSFDGDCKPENDWGFDGGDDGDVDYYD